MNVPRRASQVETGDALKRVNGLPEPKVLTDGLPGPKVLTGRTEFSHFCCPYHCRIAG